MPRVLTRGLPAVGLVAVAGITLGITGCGDGGEASEGGCDGVATGPGAVAGIDTDSGEQTWSEPIGWPDGAMVADGVLVVSAHSSVVRGFDVTSGDLRWCVDLEPSSLEIVDGFTAAGDVAVTFSGDDVIALEPATGDVRWRHEATGAEGNLAGGDFVWISDGAAAGQILTVLDPATGGVVDRDVGPPDVDAHFGVGAPPARLGDWILDATPTGSTSQQLSLSVTLDGEVAWQSEVPGFVAAIVPSTEDPVVLAIDQTGGTGAALGAEVDTRLTAYTIDNGAEMWQVSLPGTPQLVAPIDEHVAVVPVGLELHGIDPATGATRWVEEHHNPGQGGSYDQPGTFWFVAGSDDGSADVAVGVMRAEEQYRD